MNEAGKINVQRLQLVLDELAKFEIETFEKHYADVNWKSSAPKAKKEIVAFEMARNRSGLGSSFLSQNSFFLFILDANVHSSFFFLNLRKVLTKDQKRLFDQIKYFIETHPQPTITDSLTLVLPFFSISDRQTLQEMADSLHLALDWDPEETEASGQPGVLVTFLDVDSDGDDSEDEGREAVERVLRKWENAEVVDPDQEIQARANKKKQAKKAQHEEQEESYESRLMEQMEEWKILYYKVRLRLVFFFFGLRKANVCVGLGLGGYRISSSFR